MRKTANRIAAILLIMLLVLNIGSVSASAAETEDDPYYGEAYNDLPTEEHRLAYRIVEEGIAGLAPVIYFDGIVEIYYRDLLDVVRAVCVDNPRYFWFLEQGSYNYESNMGGNIVNYFVPEYVLDGKVVDAGSQELADAVARFNSKVTQILDGIPVNCSTDYDVALYLHDYLSDHITYTTEGDHPSAYAALIHGRAACYAYSKAYQCLLQAKDIRSRTITGMSSAMYGDIYGHAWNQLWLDGDCYYADVTWDDQEVVTLHECFLMPLDKIARDHRADEEFLLPDCEHGPYDLSALYSRPGMAVLSDDTAVESIARRFRYEGKISGNGVFGCEIALDGVDFEEWIDAHASTLSDLLGLSSKSQYTYFLFYDGAYLQLLDTKYNLRADRISSVTLDTNAIALPAPGKQYQLTATVSSTLNWAVDPVFETSDPEIATVSDLGLITAVGVGTCTITARSRDGSVSDTCTVTVEAAEAHTHTLRYFKATQPGCDYQGRQAYYLCLDCGLRFLDADCKNRQTDVSAGMIPETGHLNISWINKGKYHIQYCSCGKAVAGTMADHADSDEDGKCDQCGIHFGTPKPQTPAAQTDQPRWLLPVVIGTAVLVTVAVVIIALIRRKRSNAKKREDTDGDLLR